MGPHLGSRLENKWIQVSNEEGVPFFQVSMMKYHYTKQDPRQIPNLSDLAVE